MSAGGKCRVFLSLSLPKRKKKGGYRAPRRTHTHKPVQLTPGGRVSKNWGTLFFVHFFAALLSTARCACATRAAATDGMGTTAPWAPQAVVLARAPVEMRPVDSK